MRIDHVTVAGRRLATLEDEVRRLGMTPAYGGAHSNGVTHMSIVSFCDGSYLELISTIEPDHGDSPWWSRQMATDAGPCAWALAVSDVAATSERLRGLGIEVRGPIEMSRSLPDGRSAEWILSFIGRGEPGQELPFIIQDRTPRSVRVPAPQKDAFDGVSLVTIAVTDFDQAAERYVRAFDLAEPAIRSDDELAARVARFEGAPVALVGASGEGPVAAHLRVVGPGPVSFEIRPAVPSGTVVRIGRLISP